MADKIPDLHAEVRAGTGKGAARTARRNGMVPGVVYGGGVDPLALNLDFNKLLTRLRKGRFMSTLFNLKVEGHDDVRVICRGVQRHVVKDLPVHVDLMRLKRTSRVDIFIPVEFINEEECKALKSGGGTLTVVRNEVEMNVLAGDIPDHITVDLTGRKMGDVIHFSDIVLPGDIKPVISDRDFVIANIAAPKTLTADDEDDVAADEVPTTEMDSPADAE
ncbi:50S ribosomal protein L25/general stress protein Ctc [Loktanella sp. DJP18]|uniref:50S ribosomal protein L25/general stress protein Ctc n=1 Tax=Loktanella sp. DJP18 TaxID=3409788 RepID=UPI003BB6A2C6